MDSTADITPRPDAEACEEGDCPDTDLLSEVAPKGAESRVLCPIHRVEYLREVTDQ